MLAFAPGNVASGLRLSCVRASSSAPLTISSSPVRFAAPSSIVSLLPSVFPIPLSSARASLRLSSSAAAQEATWSEEEGVDVNDVNFFDEDDDDVNEDDDEVDYPPFACFPIHGTGRRKTAVARVGLIEGTGRMIANGLPLNEYFQNIALMVQTARSPISSLGFDTKYDIVVKVQGGGMSAQAQAVMLGIARALVAVNAANRPPLKAQGMLRRDSRAVERKKYGLKKARKASQFSKR